MSLFPRTGINIYQGFLSCFVYLNIRLKIRWTSSDYCCCYLSKNGQLEKYFVPEPLWSISSQCSHYGETRQLVFTSKMCEKQLCKSNILSEDAGHSSTGVFHTFFTGFSKSGTLAWNSLITLIFYFVKLLNDLMTSKISSSFIKKK